MVVRRSALCINQNCKVSLSHLHTASPAWKGLEHGEKEWHSFGAACCAAAASCCCYHPNTQRYLGCFPFQWSCIGHILSLGCGGWVQNWMWCVHVLLFTFTCSQEKRDYWEWEHHHPEEWRKSACMGCSCWPFAIITLIKVESWSIWVHGVDPYSFLFIMTPILDPLWHAADTWVRWWYCVLLLGAGLVSCVVGGSSRIIHTVVIMICQHGLCISSSIKMVMHMGLGGLW